MILPFNSITPSIDPSVYIAEGVYIIGDVTIGKNSSVWFNSVIRGDVNYIRIGENTNIQDLSILHISVGRSPLIIGNDITIGHRCIIHGCEISDNVLIGMGSVILDDVTIGSNTIIAAGSVVRERSVVPSGVLMAGVPAKVMRDISEEEIVNISKSAHGYVKNARIFISERKSS